MMSTGKARNKRRNRNKKVCLFLIMFVFVLVVGVIFTNKTFVSAHDKKTENYVMDETKETYYKSIEVKHGDTLWDIAEEYMDDNYSSVNEYIAVLKKINNLESYNLEAGTYLMVTYCDQV